MSIDYSLSNITENSPENYIDGYELVVGLEVHAELATKTKVFCGCPNMFGDEPNTNICPVCLGLPGSLPVLNHQVVELAIRLGLALNCSVHSSVFHRKNYFYPDMPKDYQVTQYDQPIDREGWLTLPSGKVIGIERAHLEEDTGKSTHIGGGGGRIHGSEYSLVDYNRAGIPLLEIVGKPELRTSEEAKQYMAELQEILIATGVSDAKMEEGSMRCDANVSVHKPGTPLGTRCELKNLNSLRSLGRAIEYEARRQIAMLEDGEKIRQETRHWSDVDSRTHTLRVKENADDYRYFLEPDLVPVVPGDTWIAAVRDAMPVLPAARRHAVAHAIGMTITDETVVVLVQRAWDPLLFAAIAAGADPTRAAVHLQHNCPPEGPTPTPATLAALTKLELDGKLTATQAKAVMGDIVAAGGDADPAALAAARGFEAMDTSALAGAVDAAIAAQPDAWAKYVAGEEKAVGALVGAIMRTTKGQADGKLVTALLQSRRTAAQA
jgi:aspartyl-tRNA(Asn)/glutamyl-tRNA(Gln) amidotransferase subunit B